MSCRKGNNEFKDVFKGYKKSRDNLIPVLQKVQNKIGYISEESVNAISDYLGISSTEIYGVATFYTQFRFTRPGDHMIKVCQGTACHVRGGQKIMDAVCKKTGIKPGETSIDYKYSVDRVACFGSCALAPVVVVDDEVYGRVSPQKIKKLLEEI
jgi:NADH:ubiquinone oxidoreductase subunit E